MGRMDTGMKLSKKLRVAKTLNKNLRSATFWWGDVEGGEDIAVLVLTCHEEETTSKTPREKP